MEVFTDKLENFDFLDGDFGLEESKVEGKPLESGILRIGNALAIPGNSAVTQDQHVFPGNLKFVRVRARLHMTKNLLTNIRRRKIYNSNLFFCQTPFFFIF